MSFRDRMILSETHIADAIEQAGEIITMNIDGTDYVRMDDLRRIAAAVVIAERKHQEAK